MNEHWRPRDWGEKGEWQSGRISCSISYAGMRLRPDRRGVPLPSYDGGVIVRPSAVEVSCAYAIDTITGGVNELPNPGCRRGWACEGDSDASCASKAGVCAARRAAWPFPTSCPLPTPRHPQPPHPSLLPPPCAAMRQLDLQRPFAPNRLKEMLQSYQENGQPYQDPGWFSGYNEVVFQAGSWNPHLPHTIEAFFVLGDKRGAWSGRQEREGKKTHTLPDDRAGFAADQHRMFIAKFKHYKGVSDAEVPLLRFNPYDWEAPFMPHT